jgi:hypothetical protein
MVRLATSSMVAGGTDHIDGSTVARGVGLSSDRLLQFARRWRDMARFWARLANGRPVERAERLRIMAQAALYAAWRAEELPKRRVRSD